MMNLFKDETIVELFNTKDYSKKYQREMTVAEWEQACQLYKELEESLADFIGKAWCDVTIENFVEFVDSTSSFELMDKHENTESRLLGGIVLYYGYEQYNETGMDIIAVLVEDVETNTVRLSKYFDVEIKGLDYAYENLELDEKYIVLDDELGLDLIYSKE